MASRKDSSPVLDDLVDMLYLASENFTAVGDETRVEVVEVYGDVEGQCCIGNSVFGTWDEGFLGQIFELFGL